MGIEYFLGYAIIAVFEIYQMYDIFHEDFNKRFDTYWPSLPLAILIVLYNTFLPVYFIQANGALNIVCWWLLIRCTYLGTRKKLFARYLLLYFSMIIAEFMVTATSMVINRQLIYQLEFVQWIVTMFSSKLLCYVLIKIIKRYLYKHDVSYDGKARPLVVIQALLICGLMLSNMGVIIHINKEGYMYASITMIVIVGMVIMMLISSDLLSRREREHADYKLLLAKNDMQMNYYSRIEEIDRQQTIYRHDMKHHLSAIAGLAEEDKCGEILKLIEQMGADIKAITPKVYTSNGLLNALLGEKESIALKSDVKIEFTIEPSVNVDFIKETDMLSMFGNLIDNAIRAEKEFTGEKVMKVRLFETDGNFLMFSVENHFVGNRDKENGEYVTTKVNKDRHGLGIESVKTMASKYGGMLTLNEENNIFMADLLLSRPYVA